MTPVTELRERSSTPVSKLSRRQDNDDDYYDYYFWNTQTGLIVKWVLFLGFWLIVALYLILGRRSAKRRARRGQRPRRGTAWFLSRSERALYDPQYAAPPAATVWPYYSYNNTNGQQNPGSHPGAGGYYQPGSYHMHDMHGQQYQPPPPVYDPNRPPGYQESDAAPPPGASKVDPAQRAPAYDGVGAAGASSGDHSAARN